MHPRVYGCGREVHAVSEEAEKAYGKCAWRERAVIEWQVLRGKKTPSEAEEWLTKKNVVENEKLRLPPFKSNPDPARFDPMIRADWTLAMAAAWIIWRTPSTVREQWNDYIFQCKEWRRRKGNLADGRTWEGWELRNRNLVSLHDVIHEASEFDPAKMKLSATKALDALWDYLTRGKVEATAIPSHLPGLERMVVPRHAWIDLSKGHFHDGPPDSVAKINCDRPCYDEVRVLRDQICGLLAPPCATSIEEQDATAWRSMGPESTDGETKLTRTDVPPIQTKVREIAKTLWPDRNYPARIADRDNSILDAFKQCGQSPPITKTIQRALKDEISGQ